MSLAKKIGATAAIGCGLFGVSGMVLMWALAFGWVPPAAWNVERLTSAFILTVSASGLIAGVALTYPEPRGRDE